MIRPTVGLMASITADGIGGAALRRLLPTALIVPLVSGWARLQGERAAPGDAIGSLAGWLAAAALVVLGCVATGRLARR